MGKTGEEPKTIFKQHSPRLNMSDIAIDLESIPSQNLGGELLSIVKRKCAKKRGDNKDVNKFCSLNPEFGQIVCIAL